MGEKEKQQSSKLIPSKWLQGQELGGKFIFPLWCILAEMVQFVFVFDLN